jgi:GntR family transcriptional repressor for pyruvate dehydrogenase complex
MGVDHPRSDANGSDAIWMATAGRSDQGARYAPTMPSKEPDAEGDITFPTVRRSVRLADRVASTLTDLILTGQLEEGSRLPPERDLCERLGVSRPVLREAVRSLTAKGLLADNPGRGHVVRALGRDSLVESLTLYLHGQRLDYTHLIEVRRVIEVEAAGLAAERTTAPTLEALREATALLREGLAPGEAAVADLAFHRAVAMTSGNEFFVVLIDSIRDVLLKVQLPTLAEEAIVRQAMTEHRRIAKAIAAGEPSRSRAAMREHLSAAELGLRAVLRADPTSAQIS